MKIMVLGGGGFGGSNLIHALLEAGYDVAVTDVLAPSHALNLQDVIDRIHYKWKATVDITPEDLADQNVVIDFAAQADVPLGVSSPRWTIDHNLAGITAVLESLRKADVDRLLYAGSGTVIGVPLQKRIDETHSLTPANPYAASKAAAEMLCMSYHRCYGVPVTILRNGLVYGPRMRKEIVIAKFLMNALRGHPLVVEGGEQTRDPNYVTNVSDAFLKAIEAPLELVNGEIFQISSELEITILKLAQKCLEVTGSRSEIKLADYRPGEKLVRQRFCIDKARRILGYEPRVGLDEGLRKTAKWLEEEQRRWH